jgi:manganese transport protein
MFTSDHRKMGEFVNPTWLKILAWITAAVIVVLNAWLLIQMAPGFLLSK